MNQLYEIFITVGKLEGCDMPEEFEGSCVNCYVPASSLEHSLEIMKANVLEDLYELLDIEYCGRIDFEDMDSDEEDDEMPTKEELMDCLAGGDMMYGAFYGFTKE